MRSRQLALWLLPGIFRRYALALLAAMVGLGLFAGFIPIVAETAGSAASAKDGLGSGALRAIQVGGYAGVDSDSEVPALTRATVAALAQYEGVESAYGVERASASISIGASGDRPSPLVPRIEAVQPPLLEGSDPSASGEVVVPSKWAAANGVKVGDSVPLQSLRYISQNEREGVKSEAVVVGIYDSAVTGIDSPTTAYASLDMVLELWAIERGRDEAWMQDSFAFPEAYVFVKDAQDISAVATRLQDAGYPAESLGSLLSQVPSLQRFLDSIRPILAGLLALFLIVVAWSTSTSLMASRHSEIGLLRAMGWSRGEVQRTFTLQFAAVGAAVGIAGAALGFLLLSILRPLTEGTTLFGLPVVININPSTFLQLGFLAVAPALLFALASALPVARLSRVPPDDVLRDLRAG